MKSKDDVKDMLEEAKELRKELGDMVVTGEPEKFARWSERMVALEMRLVELNRDQSLDDRIMRAELQVITDIQKPLT